ncbi:uncharacterized protein LOC125827465 [Solanum verrucosum]|uniref:uncharacterized protein LOC125827465 n=1 Tax=Solanum verrucosum TaxID=315347 RepID=UPI0020D018A0|nr:uncharacterized protein LOC125827465 [Solanum verrucosum]
MAVLPKFISPNQSGFVKSRSISENVLLAQEIIGDINKRNKHTNVVVKLDMTKAYDRVSWVFMTKVLRKFGFSEVIIDMIWRLLSNNWYSICINGQIHGLFQSTRGLKQGDHLSPTLFIIGAEVLSRTLNALHSDSSYLGYGLPKWSPNINHLSYVDDTILFCSGDRGSIIKMMMVLWRYEEVSGQLINMAKSYFYLHEKTPLICSIRLRKLTGIRQWEFPVTYLGCPVFYGRKKSSYFEDLMRKVARRILSWQNKFLSFGGKFILINHVLQSMPMHILAALTPPKEKRKHWVAWEEMCYPVNEGGMWFRSLEVINRAMHAKLWWNFRTSVGSLWSVYIGNKYCKKRHPVLAVGTDTGSWSIDAIEGVVSVEMTDIILNSIPPPIGNEIDRAWWTGNKSGVFSSKSAYQIVRPRRNKIECSQFIWGIKYTGNQLFPALNSVWKGVEGMKARHIIRSIPVIIIWELWIRRNQMKLGKQVSYYVVKDRYERMIHWLIKNHYPNWKDVPTKWLQSFDRIQQQKKQLFFKIVKWKLPGAGMLKCNTDGAYRGNPGISSYAFCIRNDQGDLIYAEADTIGVATNLIAETTAIWKALQFILLGICYDRGTKAIKHQKEIYAQKRIYRNGVQQAYYGLQVMHTKRRVRYQQQAQSGLGGTCRSRETPGAEKEQERNLVIQAQMRSTSKSRGKKAYKSKGRDIHEMRESCTIRRLGHGGTLQRALEKSKVASS